MLLFILHNYLIFLPLCILVFFIVSFYVKKYKQNKTPLDYLEEEYKGEINDAYEKHKVVLEEEYKGEINDAYEKHKVVLEETTKPKDFNDIQTMTKYNKNTYRDSKGRYASLK